MTSPIARPTLPLTEAALAPGTLAAGTPLGVPMSARMAELLARIEQPGLVTVVQVEARPEGGVSYALRALPEGALPASATPTAPSETLAALIRLAGAVIEGGRAGLALRDPAMRGAPATPRAEVASLGALLKDVIPRLPAPLTPALDGIVRRAVDATAPDRYEAVAQLRGDLVRLQRTMPIITQSASVELSRVAQVLTQLELPDMVAVQNVTVMTDGRTGYGLRVLGSGDLPGQGAPVMGDDLLGTGIRLGDAIIAGRDAGMQLREVAARGTTLSLAGLEGRAELIGLATVLRELLPAQSPSLFAPLAALIDRALDGEAEEPLDDVSVLRDELARQQQAARLIPQAGVSFAAPRPSVDWLRWVMIMMGLTLLGVLFLT